MTKREKKTWLVFTGSELPGEAAEAVQLISPDRQVSLTSTDCWDSLTSELQSGPPHVVVAAGGDGTVQGVVRALGPGSETIVGILPLGTGNDFARALDLPLDPLAAAEVVAEGAFVPVDLLGVIFDAEPETLAVNAMTLGLSGRVHEELDDDVKDRWGRFAYLRAAIIAAAQAEPIDVEIRVRGAEGGDWSDAWSGPLIHLSLANGSTAGGGIPIVPNSEVTDGLVHVCGVQPESAWEIGVGAASVKSEESADSPWLVEQGIEVEVELGSPSPVSVDGEIRTVRQIRARILPSALKVFRPPHTS